MSEAGFEALRDAVRVARDRQIKSTRILRQTLKGMGHSEASIEEALTTWAEHVRRTVDPSEVGL